MAVLGFHLIWTAYGTWLPGDERGHWSPLFELYGTIRQRGGHLNIPDDSTRERSRELMTELPMRLDGDAQRTVAAELADHVRTESNGERPPAWAAAVEPNHVHLLIGSLNEELRTYMGRVKGRTASEMKKLPQYRERTRFWTAKYWKVYLFDLEGILAVKDYIEAHNIRRGLPASPFPWIVPPDI